MTLKERINEDMKAAMRAGETGKRDAIRLLMAAIKQKEVDERIVLDDAQVVAVIDKMLKQRRDSITQYEAAGRQDLADAEKFEAELLTGYMPAGLPAAEIAAVIATSAATLATVMTATAVSAVAPAAIATSKTFRATHLAATTTAVVMGRPSRPPGRPRDPAA
ncbi:GatB/YqeY domain-containing protein, partial [bacterium]|nr:GatB/YqeY domain-containing protein [bacterium]